MKWFNRSWMALCILCVGSIANAQPTTISYTGYLEHDGQPLTTPAAGVELAFFIVENNNDPVSTNQARWPDQTDWWEIHPAVQVQQGSLAVELGSIRALPTFLFADLGGADDGFKFAGVMMKVEGRWVEIGGPNRRQKILAAPHAISAQEAYNFDIRNILDVRGTSRLRNKVTVTRGGLDVTGDESTAGNDLFVLQVKNGNDFIRFDGDEINASDEIAIQNHNRGATNVYGDLWAGQALDVVGTGRVRGDLIANEDLRVEGNLRVDGNITNISLEREDDDDLVSNHDGGRERRLGSTTNRICFLTVMEVSETDESNEPAKCRVENRENGSWYLRAETPNGGDPKVVCNARCLSW